MTEEIDLGLFARLMQMPAPARNDLLEYLGQNPVSAEDALRDALKVGATEESAEKARETQQ